MSTLNHSASEEYTAKSIHNLDQHTHLLQRLSLTFGDEMAGSAFSSQKGVAIREVLDNAIDEVRAGYGNTVRLSFFKDRSFEVKDSGRGLPVDVGRDNTGRAVSGIYLTLGTIQSGGKFTTDSNRYSSGLNGVGASSTIHTSKRADITVYRSGKKYSLSFQDGTPGFFDAPNDPDANFTELDDYAYVKEEADDRSEEEKKKFPTGTVVRCWLRDEVFPARKPYNDQDLVERFKLTAYLVPELYAEIYNELSMVEDFETGESAPQQEAFHFDNGLMNLLDSRQIDRPLSDKIFIEAVGKYEENKNTYDPDSGKTVAQVVKRNAPISLIFSYGEGYETSIYSFVNTIHTKLGGEHEKAMELAMRDAFNARFTTMKGLLTKADKGNVPNLDDFREGLTAILSVQASEPSFKSQTKEELGGDGIGKAIKDALIASLTKWINDKDNQAQLEIIANKVVTSMRNRVKARDARELNRAKNKVSSSALPAKLVDCKKAGTEDAEFYICEGDSALTSMKSARSADIHAILPIRGKIIAAHDAGAKEVLANVEVQDIAKSMGAGIGSDFDISAMRYGKVFLAVDADYDGSHIASLLYGLFWNYFRPVIEEGRFFKLELPLYVVSTKEKSNEKFYARNEKERDDIINDLMSKKKKFIITRLKGLGEMNEDDLAMHGFDPHARVVTQVTVKDVENAVRSLDMVFNKANAGVRKEWISTFDFDEEV